MPEHLPGQPGIAPTVDMVPNQQLTEPLPTQARTSGLFDRPHNRWAAVMAAGTAAAALIASPFPKERAAYAANTETAVMSMPYTGRWSAYVHPSSHDYYSADWATDIYAPAGTEARFRVGNLSGDATYTVSNVGDTSCGAGKRVRVNVKVDNVNVGWVQYEHLETNIANGAAITPGSVLGKTKRWTGSNGEVLPCYQVTNDGGVHLHVGMKNTQDNHSCWVDHGAQGVSLNDGTNLGILGSSNAGIQQACGETPGNGGDIPFRPIPGDFDGNGITDAAVYRPGDGYWHIRGVGDYQWGGHPGDIPVPADYNGDRKTDIAIYRPSNGVWYIRGIGDFQWGGHPGDIPVPLDYNGNGISDITVYRPNIGVWYVRGLGDIQWGGHPGDVPVPGYYDPDEDQDIAIYRPSNGIWYIRNVGDFQWGGHPGDIPAQGDYTGNGITDMTVYRPNIGVWYTPGIGDTQWGGHEGDVPVPGRHNNDAVYDRAIYRPSNGGWYVQGVGDFPYGWSTDIPAAQTLNAALLGRYGLVEGY